jgi:fatty acid desaturase
VFPLRWLLLPYNISLHFEHHLNYGVPWYHLGAFHRDVLRLMPPADQRRYVNANVIRQLSGAPLES